MDPQVFISRIVKLGSDFRYPSNIGNIEDGLHHFMVIKELQYKEENKRDDPINGQTRFENLIGSRNDASFFTEKRSYILFLPQGGLTSQYSANYDAVDVGFFGKLVENEIGGMVEKLGNYFDEYGVAQQTGDQTINNTFDFYGKALDAFANSDAVQTTQDFITSNRMVDQIKFNVASAIGGLATLGNDKVKGEDVAALSMRAQRNPYTSLVFVGNKTKRTHSFKFQFHPKSKTESDTISRIVANLKHGMLPSLPKMNARNDTVTSLVDDTSFDELSMPAAALTTTSKQKVKKVPRTYQVPRSMDSNLFKVPNVYTINFYDVNGGTEGNKHLHKIGQSVLTSLKVDYGEAFYEDTAMPTEINLSLEFKENFTLSREHIRRGY